MYFFFGGVCLSEAGTKYKVRDKGILRIAKNAREQKKHEYRMRTKINIVGLEMERAIRQRRRHLNAYYKNNIQIQELAQFLQKQKEKK